MFKNLHNCCHFEVVIKEYTGKECFKKVMEVGFPWWSTG